MKPALQPRSLKVIVRRLVPTSLSVFQDTGPVCVKVTFGYERAFKTKPARLVPGHIRTGTYDPAEQSLLQGVYHWGAVFMFSISQPETVIKIAAVDANLPSDRNKLGMCHLHLLPLIQSQRVSFVGSLPLVDLTDHVVGFLDTHVILMGNSGPCRPTTSKIASSVYRTNSHSKPLETSPTFVSHSKPLETSPTFVSHSKPLETPPTFGSHSKALEFASPTFVSKSTQTDASPVPWTRKSLPSRIMTRPATAPLDASLFRRPAESCEPLTPLRVLVKEVRRKHSEPHNDPTTAAPLSSASESETNESTVDEFAFSSPLHSVRVNTRNERMSDFFSVGKSDRTGYSAADGDNSGLDSDESSSDSLTSHTEELTEEPQVESDPIEPERLTSRCPTRRIPSDWVLGSLSSSSESSPESRRQSRPPSRLPSEWVLHDISSSAERLASKSHTTSATPHVSDGPQLIYQPADEEPVMAPLYLTDPSLLNFDTQPSYESTIHGSRVLNWIRTVSREIEECPSETISKTDSPGPHSHCQLIYLPSGESELRHAPMYVPDPTMLTLDDVSPPALGGGLSEDRALPAMPSLPLKKKVVSMSSHVDISPIDPCSGSRRSWDSLELSSWRSRRHTHVRNHLMSYASSESDRSTSTDGTVLLGDDDVFVIRRRKSRGVDKASSSHDEVGVAMVMASDQSDSICEDVDHDSAPSYSSTIQSPHAVDRKRVSFSAVGCEAQTSSECLDGLLPELRTMPSRRSSSLFSGTLNACHSTERRISEITEQRESALSVSSNCRDLFNQLASKDMRRQGTVPISSLQSESDSSVTEPIRALSAPGVQVMAHPTLSLDVFESWKTIHNDAAEEALRRRYFGSNLSDGTEGTVESTPYRSVIVPTPADSDFTSFAKSKSMRHKGHHHDDASDDVSLPDSTPRRLSAPPQSEESSAVIRSGHSLLPPLKPTVTLISGTASDSSDYRRKPLEPVCREHLSLALTDFLTAQSLSWSSESMEAAYSTSGSDLAITRRSPRVRGAVSTPQVPDGADNVDQASAVATSENESTGMEKTAEVSDDAADNVIQTAVVSEFESSEMEKTVDNMDQVAVATLEDECAETEKTIDVFDNGVHHEDQASAVATSEDESAKMEKPIDVCDNAVDNVDQAAVAVSEDESKMEKTIDVSDNAVDNVDQASAVATSEDESAGMEKTIDVSDNAVDNVDQASAVANSEDESTETERTVDNMDQAAVAVSEDESAEIEKTIDVSDNAVDNEDQASDVATSEDESTYTDRTVDNMDQAAVAISEDESKMEKTIDVSDNAVDHEDQASAVATLEDESAEMEKTIDVSDNAVDNVDQASAVATSDDESTEMGKTVDVSDVDNEDQAAVAASKDESTEMGRTAEVSDDAADNVDQTAVALLADESAEMEKTIVVSDNAVDNEDQAAVAASKDESTEMGRTAE
ncbi:MAG: uncharacterized protein KVP18_001202, partial [Porospora cf. gigantea A]